MDKYVKGVNEVVYVGVYIFFFFKQKTAYEIVSRDWSSDVCSSDLQSCGVKALCTVVVTNTTNQLHEENKTRYQVRTFYCKIDQLRKFINKFM